MAHCPKCNGAMTKGFIIDHGDYGTAHVGTFHAGEPTKGFFGNLKLNKKEQIPITTLRCGRCGFLESYAKG